MRRAVGGENVRIGVARHLHLPAARDQNRAKPLGDVEIERLLGQTVVSGTGVAAAVSGIDDDQLRIGRNDRVQHRCRRRPEVARIRQRRRRDQHSSGDAAGSDALRFEVVETTDRNRETVVARNDIDLARRNKRKRNTHGRILVAGELSDAESGRRRARRLFVARGNPEHRVLEIDVPAIVGEAMPLVPHRAADADAHVQSCVGWKQIERGDDDRGPERRRRNRGFGRDFAADGRVFVAGTCA